MPKHTPTPWYCEPYNDELGASYGYCIGAKKVRSIAITTGKSVSCLQEENKANAEFIVRACNSHDALLEALQIALVQIKAAWARAHYAEIGDAMHTVRNAITLATKE